MYRLLVIMEVADFLALAQFEQQAAAIMADHQGRIAQAFESVRNPDGSGEEVHLVEFADEAGFVAYRSDPRLAELQALRSKTIPKTEIRVLGQEKHYHRIVGKGCTGR